MTEGEYRAYLKKHNTEALSASPEKENPVKPVPPLESGPYDGMNQTEARYARTLEDARSLGKIVRWDFESVRFVLAAKTTYTPDFMVTHPGYIEFVEIKGFLRDDAGVKFKVARDMFPQFKWTMLTWDGKKKEWQARLPVKDKRTG
jgi:hypothetical protein